MNRRLYLIAAAAVAVVILVAGGLLQYLGGGDSSTPPETLAPGATVEARAKSTVDGRTEDLTGTCAAPADDRSVNMSLSGPTTKLNISVDKSDPPKVMSVVLATSTMAFVYQPGQEGQADATRDGKSYHVKGTLLRYGFVSAQLDVTVTCA